MVQMREYRGFVSNIYVYMSFIQATMAILFFAILVVFEKNLLKAELILFLGLICLVFFLIQYLRAPRAFSRVILNSEGIRCGAVFIRYDDIKTVSISKGYAENWFGFRHLESLTGIYQHRELRFEDMICINCDFKGYRTKRCVYIPKNRKTESILTSYSQKFMVLFNNHTEQLAEKPKIINTYTVLYLAGVLAICLVFCVVMVLIVSAGLITAYKLALLIPIGLIIILTEAFKELILAFVLRKIN